MYQGVIDLRQTEITNEIFDTGTLNEFISLTGTPVKNPFLLFPQPRNLFIRSSQARDNTIDTDILASQPIFSSTVDTQQFVPNSQEAFFAFLQTRSHFNTISPKANVDQEANGVRAGYTVQQEVDTTQAGGGALAREGIRQTEELVLRKPVPTLVQAPFATAGSVQEVLDDGAIALTIDENGEILSGVTLSS